MSNGVKLNGVQNDNLRFLIYLDLDPKVPNFNFPKKNYCLQNPTFLSYPKNGIYVIEVHANNIHTRFQSNILGFGCPIARNKTGKGDDVTFLKCNF